MRSRTVAGERWAVAGVFAVHGAVVGTFASRLPWIADRLRLGPGQLGIALTMAAIGALSGTPLAARFVHRYGGRSATRIAMTAWCAALVLPALSPNLPALAIALAVCGFTSSVADVAMNGQGVDVEVRLGRSIMSGLHGCWSVGSAAAAFAGSLSAGARIDARVQFAVVAAVLIALGALATTRFSAGTRAPESGRPLFTIPRGRVLLIGLVGFCAVFPEWTANDWSAVYVRRVLQADEARAALATTMFALSMTVGRLLGDFVIRRIGARRTVLASGLAASTGAILVTVAWSVPVALAGFVLLGTGVAVVVPLTFAAGGRAGTSPDAGVAGVATISYSAGLAAPGIVGGVAAVASLRGAFVLVAVFATLVAAGARLLGGALDTPAPGDALVPPPERAGAPE